MRRRVRRQAPRRLLELSLAARAPSAAALVPRDRDVDEALVEVALSGVRGAPRELELLVRGEELAATQEVNPALVARP